jgi:hypothetical protein
MSLGFLDFNSYTFVGGFTVQRGKDLIIPDSLVLSQTMLVKWQIRQLAKGVTIDQIPPAILSASLEIQGLGTLNHDEHQIIASQQGQDVVQLWTIDPSLPHLLKFSQVSDLVTNSVLEFYSSNLSMAVTNNPSNTTVDLSAVTAAIASSSAAEIAATQALQAAETRQVKKIVESTYNTTVWSNTPVNHAAIQPDPLRMGIVLVNTGNKPVYFDLFIDIATKTPVPQYDNVMQPGGSVTIGIDEAASGVLLYGIGNNNNSTVFINLQL